MANYSNLKTAIENAVDWNNGDNEITGQNLLDILETIIDSLGAKYKFADVATPSSSISTPDEPLFYLAGAGTYANFSGLTVNVQRGTLAIFYYDTAWHWTSVRTDSDAFFNVNQYLETPSTTYTKANARNAVPSALRSKGMIITYLTTNGWIIEQNLSTSGTWNADENWQTIGPVSVSQNTITLEEWAANTDYVVGNQRQTGTPTKYYRCITAHTSGSTFDATELQNWSEITQFGVPLKTPQTINIGTDEKPITQKCISLKGIGATYTLIPNVGDIMYRTDLHLLHQRISSNTYNTIPFYEGGVYICDNNLFIWDGADLVNAKEIKDIRLSSNDVVSGSYRASGGNIQTLSGFFYSNPFKVVKGTKFKANAVSSSSAQSNIAMLSWVKSDGTFISLILNPSSAGTYEYIFENDGYVSISGSNADLSEFEIKYYLSDRVDYLEEHLSDLEGRMTTAESDINTLKTNTADVKVVVKFGVPVGNITQGYYRSSTGVIQSAGGLFYSNPIPVKVGTKFKANAVSSSSAQSNIAMLSWVKSDGTFISLILNPSSAGTYEYTFEDEGYVCVSGSNGDLAKFTITTSVSEQIDALNEKFDTLAEQTTQDILDLNSDVNSIKEKIVKTNSTNTTSGYYRTSAGVIQTLGGYFYSNPLRVIPGDTFKANNVSQYSAASTIAMLSWVKSDGTFISLILNPSGAGTYEYTFEDEGYVCISGTTGDMAKYSITSHFNDRLDQLESDVDTLLNDVSDIQEELPTMASYGGYNKLVNQSNTNPIEKVRYDCGLMAIFKTIGVIGDSLASGEMQGYDSSGNRVFEDMYEFSWGQQIAKMTGIDVYNFSQGGQYAKGWMNGNTARTWDANDVAGGAHSNKKQCYFIGLAHNDKTMVENNTYTAGIGMVADINDADYTQNADSYVGWYARIIQAIKSIEPRAYIFCITPPLSEYAAYSEQIRNIVEHFAAQRVYLIDIATYGNSGSQLMWMNSHLSAAGYLYFAYLIANYVDWIVRHNQTDFRYTSLVGTDILDTNPN